MQPRRLPTASITLLVALVATLLLPPVAERLGGGGGTNDRRTAVADAWPADAVIYHVFVDRFADGDREDTQVAGTPEDPGYAEALTDWMGGDLAGARARLDHVVATGANTVWLSPVTPGPYFHGYHPTDLTDVDPRFGDVEELRGFVADAHDRGLRVIYDLVLNHTSDRHPWFREAQADCGGSAFVAYYRFRSCPDGYAGFAGLAELPQLDPDHPPLRQHLFDEVLPFWLDDVGVDGFRLDHVEGPSRDFWRALRQELDERWPGTFLLGEVWAQQAVIDGYGGLLDAATAFPFRDRLVASIGRGGDVPAISLPVASWLDDEGFVRTEVPLPATYVSSHDQPRFATATAAGAEAARVALAYRTILTLPGIPVVYYGDEVGLTQTDSLPEGAPFQDRWYREPMPWDPAVWDTELLDAVSTTARLRTTTPALHRGTMTEHLAEGPLWVYERRADEEGVLVVVNNGEDEVHVDLREVLPASTLGPGVSWETVRVPPLDLVLLDLP